MKIIFLNLYKGVEEKERLDKIISFIKKQQPDILCLCELIGWDKKKIDLFKEKIGIRNHYFTTSNTKYAMAIFTDKKVKSFKVIKKEFHHALIKLQLKKLNIFFTHLSPFSEDKRLKEIDTILNMIGDENSLLIGDLNSLSPVDKYDNEEILKKQEEIGIKKFGIKKIRKEVQQKILDFGMIDTLKKETDILEYTIPTKYNKDKAHLTKLRLDYAYVTSKLREKIKISKVIRDEETEYLSDHYPLILELEL